MGLLHLVTGRAGAEHVTGADHGAFNAALLVAGNYVLNTGNKFSASVVTNNSIKILDGELIVQGRHVRLKPGLYEEVTIENGAQDYKRNDLIVVRYTKNENTGIENTSFVVIKGTPDATTATDPAYTSADILGGALVCDMPLYRVPIDGLNVGELVPLFETIDSFDARIKALVNGTMKAGNAEKLDGHDSEYFASAESVANIQTTSRATLSSAGWYRVAEINTNRTSWCPFELRINKNNNYGGSSSCVLRYVADVDNPRIKLLDGITGYSQYVSKIRVTADETKGYIEIYYALSYENMMGFVLNNSYSALTDIAWSLYDTPTLTEETVDGVTVKCTYDIPANASPVTDLDLVQFEGTETLNTSILEYALTLDKGIHTVRLGGVSYPSMDNGSDLPSNYYRFCIATINKYSSTEISVLLWGRRDTTPKLCPPVFNLYNGQEWSGWKTFATTADLADYFKNTGGDIDGNVNVKSDSAVIRVLGLKNSKRDIYQEIDASGIYNLYDGTNGRRIIRSSADGLDNTFNGTASGNLALSNGEEPPVVHTNSNTILRLNNTMNGAYTWIGFRNADVSVGSLGFGADGKLYGILNSKVKELLHSGNFSDYALAKDGGCTANKAARTVMQVNNTAENAVAATMGYRIGGTSIGEIGISTALGGAFYRLPDGTNNILHHDGNSAKVVVSATAPSDTSAIWVY